MARNALTDMLKREIEDVARRSAELPVHEAGIHLEEVGLEQPRKRRERPQRMTPRIVSRRELARARDGVDAAGKAVTLQCAVRLVNRRKLSQIGPVENIALEVERRTPRGNQPVPRLASGALHPEGVEQ